MVKFNKSYLLLLFFAGLLLVGCSKSNDQRDFENEANTTPQNFTETNNQGDVISADPDDWRVSPMYRGLISIGVGISDSQPPYPNPLSFNQNLTVNIYINNIETLNRIEIFTFEIPSELNGPFAPVNNISSPTLETISLSGEFISGSSGGSQAAGLYRVLIYDGRQNLITYGDVKINP
jgi:hypothetical protein